MNLATGLSNLFSTPPAFGHIRGPVISPRNQIDYTQQHLTLKDFERITDLLRKQYDSKYPDPDWMSPRLMESRYRDGKIRVFTARDSTGEIIASSCVTKTDDGMVKVGQLIVDKNYQGKGIGSEVASGAIKIAKGIAASEGLETIVALCFTGHSQSQSIFYKAGFRPAGLALSSRHDLFGLGRESVVVMTLVTDERVRQEKYLEVPKSLVPSLKAAFQSLNCVRSVTALEEAPVTTASKIPIALEIDFTRLHSTGGIHIAPQGLFSIASLLQAEERFSQAVHATVSIPSSPLLSRQLATLVACGYVFSSVRPGVDGDEIRMQKLLCGSEPTPLALPHPETAIIYQSIIGSRSGVDELPIHENRATSSMA